MNDVLIVGAGIGGLTTALYPHRLGIPCRVIEAVPEIRPLGVGINLLPHAMKELGDLGLQPALEAIAVETQEMRFYNCPIGRASCRDRVCQYVYISVVGVSIKKHIVNDGLYVITTVIHNATSCISRYKN